MTIEGNNKLEEKLNLLRTNGWVVAVHNDYYSNGVLHTFWLFTHKSGIYVKGEGLTDEQCLNKCIFEIEDKYQILK